MKFKLNTLFRCFQMMKLNMERALSCFIAHVRLRELPTPINTSLSPEIAAMGSEIKRKR